MALREGKNELRDQIHSGIGEYNFEKSELGTDRVEEYIDPWNEMMRVSNVLKQKYSFLEDFMKKNRINVVKEEKYSDEILNESGKVIYYELDANGTKYFIVDKDGNIKDIPFRIIDRTEDFEVIDDRFRGEKVSDFIDENTTHILRHEYDDYGNDQSPLYVIPYIK